MEYSAAYKRIYQDLLNKIKNSEIKIGDQLPSEMQLAEQYGVSRITSKKAFEMLVNEGYIKRERGKGSFLISDRVAEGANTEWKGKFITVGCIITDFDNYATGLLHGLEKSLSENNANLLLKLTKGDYNVEKSLIGQLKDHVDGFIILPVQNQFFSNEMLQLIVEKKPLVLVDRHLKELPAVSVSTDNLNSAERLINHLLDKGMRNIGLISSQINGTTSIEDRLEGYVAAHQKRGIATNTELILSTIESTIPNNRSKEKVKEDIESIKKYLLRMQDSIEAVFAIEYNIVKLIESALEELNCEKLKNLEIVCFDYPINIFTKEIKYTHIAQDEETMGYEAGQRVLQMIRQEGTPKSMFVEGTLIMKGSI